MSNMNVGEKTKKRGSRRIHPMDAAQDTSANETPQPVVRINPTSLLGTRMNLLQVEQSELTQKLLNIKDEVDYQLEECQN